MPVERWQLPAWVNDIVTDGQLKLGDRERWRGVVMHRDMPLTATETLVALGVAQFHNDDQQCAFPSMTTLSKATKLSRPAVARALRALDDAGWLERESTGKRKVNRYYLRFPSDDPRLGAHDTHVGAQDTHVGAQDTHVGAQDTQSRCTVHPEVTNEGSKEVAKEGSNDGAAPPAPPGTLGTQEPKGAGEQDSPDPVDVAAHRAAIRQALGKRVKEAVAA